MCPEDYVHRIGRTGRAGSDGAAVSLVSPEEHGLLGGIQRLLGREIPLSPIAGFEIRPGYVLDPDPPRRSAPPRRDERRGPPPPRSAQPQHRASGRGRPRSPSDR
jgi:ATP-dependent RNA helicase RhlE